MSARHPMSVASRVRLVPAASAVQVPVVLRVLAVRRVVRVPVVLLRALHRPAAK